MENNEIPLNNRLNEIFKKMYEFNAEEYFYYEYPLSFKSKEMDQL